MDGSERLAKHLMERHMKHVGRLPVACKCWCGEMFTGQKALAKHLRKVGLKKLKDHMVVGMLRTDQ
jgi:hypothetical protein